MSSFFDDKSDSDDDDVKGAHSGNYHKASTAALGNCIPHSCWLCIAVCVGGSMAHVYVDDGSAGDAGGRESETVS